MAKKAKAPAVRREVATKGWPTVSLGEVVVHRQEQERNPESAGFERYLMVDHRDANRLKIAGWGLIADGDLPPTFYKVFRAGQVLYPTTNPHLRRTAYADFDGICGEKTLTLESNGEIEPRLLPFIFQTERFIEYAKSMAIGSTNPHVRWRDIAAYEFPLPPKDEQRLIAQILWAANENFENWKEVHSQLNSVRKLLLHRCMRGEESSGPKKATPLGRLPRNWCILSIGEAGDVQLGRQRSPAYQTKKHTHPYLRVANVFDGFLKLDDVLEMDFDERDYATFSLRPGDILLNEGQSRELVGRLMYNGEINGCCFQNTLIRFRAKVGLDPKYAFYFLQHLFYSGAFAAIARQTTSIAHLGAERFCKLEMAIPPTEEQERIARILDALGEACGNASSHIQATEQLKSCIGDGLLSGKRDCNAVQ